jgi:hypothetical protein
MASQARRVPSVAVIAGSVFSEKLEIRRNGITVALQTRHKSLGPTWTL